MQGEMELVIHHQAVVMPLQIAQQHFGLNGGKLNTLPDRNGHQFFGLRNQRHISALLSFHTDFSDRKQIRTPQP